MELSSVCVGCGKHHFKDTPCADGTRWVTMTVQCRICNNKHQAIMPYKPPAGPMSGNIECPNCGNMTADVAEENDR